MCVLEQKLGTAATGMRQLHIRISPQQQSWPRVIICGFYAPYEDMKISQVKNPSSTKLSLALSRQTNTIFVVKKI
jgi:hypothetical protein